MVCGLENIAALWGGPHRASKKQKTKTIEKQSIYFFTALNPNLTLTQTQKPKRGKIHVRTNRIESNQIKLNLIVSIESTAIPTYTCSIIYDDKVFK